MDKCNFCGRERLDVDFLIAGTNGHICNDCVTQANQIALEQTDPDAKAPERKKIEYPLNKTARAIAYNREVTLNIFDNQFIIETGRSIGSNDHEYYNKIRAKQTLSPETFCLLVKLLNEAVKEFGIDYEAAVEKLTQGRKLHISFADLEAKEEPAHDKPA